MNIIGGLTRRRSRQAAECRARRPGRLVQRETDGVTPLATRSVRTFLSSRQAARRSSARAVVRLAA